MRSFLSIFIILNVFFFLFINSSAYGSEINSNSIVVNIESTDKLNEENILTTNNIKAFCENEDGTNRIVKDFIYKDKIIFKDIKNGSYKVGLILPDNLKALSQEVQTVDVDNKSKSVNFQIEKVNDKERIVININSDFDSQFNIIIKDKTGNIINESKVKSNCPQNFYDISKGDYTVELVKDQSFTSDNPLIKNITLKDDDSQKIDFNVKKSSDQVKGNVIYQLIIKNEGGKIINGDFQSKLLITGDGYNNTVDIRPFDSVFLNLKKGQYNFQIILPENIKNLYSIENLILNIDENNITKLEQYGIKKNNGDIKVVLNYKNDGKFNSKIYKDDKLFKNLDLSNGENDLGILNNGKYSIIVDMPCHEGEKEIYDFEVNSNSNVINMVLQCHIKKVNIKLNIENDALSSEEFTVLVTKPNLEKEQIKVKQGQTLQYEADSLGLYTFKMKETDGYLFQDGTKVINVTENSQDANIIFKGLKNKFKLKLNAKVYDEKNNLVNELDKSFPFKIIDDDNPNINYTGQIKNGTSFQRTLTEGNYLIVFDQNYEYSYKISNPLISLNQDVNVDVRIEKKTDKKKHKIDLSLDLKDSDGKKINDNALFKFSLKNKDTGELVSDFANSKNIWTSIFSEGNCLLEFKEVNGYKFKNGGKIDLNLNIDMNLTMEIEKTNVKSINHDLNIGVAIKGTDGKNLAESKKIGLTIKSVKGNYNERFELVSGVNMTKSLPEGSYMVTFDDMENYYQEFLNPIAIDLTKDVGLNLSYIKAIQNKLIESEIYVSYVDEFKNKIYDNLKAIVNDNEEFDLKANVKNIVKLNVGLNKIKIIPNDGSRVVEETKNVIINSSSNKILFNVEKINKKSNLNVYSTVVLENELSANFNEQIYGKVYKNDEIVKEITLNANSETAIENLDVGIYKIVFSTSNKYYDLIPKEQILMVRENEINKARLTIVLKESLPLNDINTTTAVMRNTGGKTENTTNSTNKTNTTINLTSSGNAGKDLDQNDSRAIGNVINGEVAASSNFLYYLVGNLVSGLGLGLGIFSLNPNINVFKRPFKYIMKKLGFK